MKRPSIYILYAVTIFALVLGFDLYFQIQRTQAFFVQDLQKRANALPEEAAIARKIEAVYGSPKHLRDYLNALVEQDRIHFWIILKGEEVEATSITSADSAFLHSQLYRGIPFSEINLAEIDDLKAFFVVQILADKRKLVLGTNNSSKRYIQNELAVIWDGILSFLLGIMVITVGTFAFFFRDIMQSIRKLREQNSSGRSRKRTFFSGFAISREADLLARGLDAYDTQAAALKEQKELYRWQILPSLRSEMESGVAPPYDFPCTLVRTDINNFTKIYNAHSVTEFMATINDFFSEVSEIVSHYGGYVHEFVGDEVIYYFKDSEVGNSVAVALSAIDDINDAASRIHTRVLRERKYPFTVKSALAHDRLRFGRLANGFGLSGPSLIETVRIVSTVSEKDGNVVVLDERHLEKLGDLITTSLDSEALEPLFKIEFHSEVSLKGFNGQRRIYACRGRARVDEYFQWGSSKTWRRLSYFRSDRDLQKILSWLKEDWHIAPCKEVVEVVAIVRLLPMTANEGVAVSILGEWLSDLLKVDQNDAHARDVGLILASAIRLIENFANEFASEKSRQALLTLIEPVGQHFDRRVAANAIEVLGCLRLEPTERLEALTSSLDNRVAANAIVWAGKREITPFVLQELDKMLHARSSARIASGIFALGEIASHHRRQDPVYFGTQVELLSLMERLGDWVLSDDESVRRQTIAAIQKIGDPQLLSRLQESLSRRAS